MSDLKTELTRNLVGFSLIAAGVGVALVGAHYRIEKMLDAGLAFFPASLLALQTKRTPDGNTTTTQVTVPVPAPPAAT